ncbi:MAG: putative ABC transport system ATP-binding protein, partial [Planctomycetota bacterium]
RHLTRSPHWREIDISLDAGEILVIHGASGSGKSLLLRSIADLDPVDSGDLRLAGKSINEYTPSAWRRGLLYLHQGAPALDGTVRNNLDAISAITSKAIASVPGLADDAPANTLSGGERQRLALHRALACAPAVLLLDEATSAMDPELAVASEHSISDYVQDGHAAIWVSHDTSLAERLGAQELTL